MSSPRDTASMATALNPKFWGVPIYEPALPVLDSESHVLDIGCGIADSKTLTAVLDRASSEPCVIRLDSFKDTLEQNPGEGKIVGDATALPLGNGAVNAVVTSELTPDNHYFSTEWPTGNRAKLMSEIARVVAIGGHWLAYNESIDTTNDDSRPPGFAVRYLMHKQVKIAPYRLSYQLPFGVFEKHVEPVNPRLIGENVNGLSEDYRDEYARALDDTYPIEQTIGQDLFRDLKAGDMSQLDGSHSTMHLWDEDSLKRQFLIRSAKAGRWMTELVPFDYPDAEERLNLLCMPFGSKLTYRLKKETPDGYLRAIDGTGDFHLKVIGKHVAILPRQQLLDEFIDFRDTDVDESWVQMNRTLRDKA